MCDSHDVVSPSGSPIEEMCTASALMHTNRVLGPKSQVFGKDRLVAPLSSKPEDERSPVRLCSAHKHYQISMAPLTYFFASSFQLSVKGSSRRSFGKEDHPRPDLGW